MHKKFSFLLVGVLLVTALAACQTNGPSTSGGFAGPGNRQFGTPNPDMLTQIASNPEIQTRIASGGGPGGFVVQGELPAQATTPAPSVESTAANTPEPGPTETPETNAAVQAAQAYFAALEKGDFASAADLVSGFSRMANKITAGDIVADLTQQQSSGSAWSKLEIVDSQIFDDKTVLVHVTYQLSMKDAQTGSEVKTIVDELWPFRLENKQWLYNWTNIIDFKTLGIDAKTAGGLTMKPLQLIRYTDKIRLVMLAQNGTSGAIVIGRPNQILATFHFGSQGVDAVRTRYFFDAWRGYTDVYIDVMGFFSEYPDAVEIVKFTTNATSPWFTFGLVE